MNYNKMLMVIALENNTTPQEVDREIRYAIQAAGYDIPPEVFISLLKAKAENEIRVKNKQSIP